jgi:hypothetical protein
VKQKIDFSFASFNSLVTKICSASANTGTRRGEVLINNTSTSTVHNNHRHNHRRVVFLDSNRENHSLHDSQHDQQTSNTTALTSAIAPPAPLFPRPGKSKKPPNKLEVRSRVRPKSKKPNQNLHSNQCACTPVAFEPQRLTAPARTLALAVQQLAEAQPRSHHHHHLTSNATRPRAATSPSSASGESKAKPILVSFLQEKKQKAKNTKTEPTLLHFRKFLLE